MRENNQDLTMMRLVLLDYIGGIKEGWKRLWGAETVAIFWDHIFIGILGASDFYNKAAGSFPPSLVWGYGVIIFIMFFGCLISRMYPGQLEKTLFFCPLTQAEKKQYVETGYRLRIALPMMLYILAGIFWRIFGIIPLVPVMGIGIWMFFYLACANIYCVPEQGKDIFDHRYPLKGIEICQAVNLILGIGEIIGLSRLISKDFEVMRGRIYQVVILLFQIVLYICMRKKLYPRIMERALWYEDND